MDAVESGIKPCDLAKEALHLHPLTPLTLSKAIIVGYLGLFSIYWIFCFLRFFAQLRDILGIRHFYYNSLHVTDNEIQTMSWATVLEKVVQLQYSQQLCVVKDLTAHDIMMRLMRKENYLIGMLNKGVLAFPISLWIPGVGPTVRTGSNGMQHCLILTKPLEWTLNWCILQSMFDRNFCVRRDFIYNPNALKKRLMVVGLAMLVLAPFLVIFMLVYLFLRHAEQFYNHPSTASSRRWSNLSRWIFREFNEADHLFKHRISSSAMHASDYLKQFPSPIISIIAKFISFVSGGFAAILIIIAFLEESLLEGHIFGRNLLWYAAVFGTITAISRAAVTEELQVLDQKGQCLWWSSTHIICRRNGGAEKILRGSYTGMMLLEEMASIFLTPFLLLFVVPKRVDDILQFIADFTVDVEGVGHVCSFSAFDFQNYGNSNYGSPYNAPRSQRSCQGKMEKSFLSFQSSYPSWEPNIQGKQFLLILELLGTKICKDRELDTRTLLLECGEGAPVSEAPVIETFLFQGKCHLILPLGSLWLLDIDHRNHPYLLDWYYTSRPHSSTNNTKDATAVPFEAAEQQHSRDYWTPSNLEQNEARYDEEFWGHNYQDRSESHFGASTSAPFFQESVLQHQDSSNLARPTRSHWWARSGPSGAQPQASFLEPPDFHQASFLEPPDFHQASFLEPPDFNRYASENHHDNLSEKSLEDHEQHLDWRSTNRLSRTTYLDDDIEAGRSVSLLFDDIYSRPPDTPPAFREPPSF
ncbi:LOW QUALITY PROTEIN: autophagy-related protein 9-like isoform X1 [Populus alba x Populus x berolinensis]|nr:LOW QUALITY PROTEIN: autophagy-related protein 9-like isoform X1 [Populus alba x Populus x berolinensis]